MRPDNWKNPYLVDLTDASSVLTDYTPIVNPEPYQAYEAGADAYEEAIWELARNSPTGTFTFDTNTVNIFGGKNED